MRTPTAWACRTCGRVDWADTQEQLAQPEHISHRGVDIGTCKGVMVPLFAAEQPPIRTDPEENTDKPA